MAVAVIHDGLSMMERLERTGSMLPKGVAYAINSGRNGLEMVTYAQLKANRIAKQKTHLDYVLSSASAPVRRAGFIWVFYTPGIGGNSRRVGLMGGWWTYLRTLDGDNALDFRTHDYRLLEIAMKLFPCGVFPVVDNAELWKKAFARQFARPGRFKRQGLAPVWVTYGPGNRMEIEKP